MAKWWQVSWKRVAIGLALVVAGLYLIGGAISLMAPWIEVRLLSRDFQKNPSLKLIPTRLPDKSIAPLNGAIVQAYGLSLKTPWEEKPTVHDGRYVKHIAFPTEVAGILVFDPANLPDPYRSMSQDPKLRWILGERTLGSRYELFSEEMSSTPADMHWWLSSADTSRQFLLLSHKELAVVDTNAIYSVQSGNLKGFQLGNPAIPPFHVVLELFDPADRHYQFVVLARGKPPLTQAQLNAMIASIQPASAK